MATSTVRAPDITRLDRHSPAHVALLLGPPELGLSCLQIRPIFGQYYGDADLLGRPPGQLVLVVQA